MSNQAHSSIVRQSFFLFALILAVVAIAMTANNLPTFATSTSILETRRWIITAYYKLSLCLRLLGNDIECHRGELNPITKRHPPDPFAPAVNIQPHSQR